MSRLVIDSETGEVMTELYNGDRIVRASSVEAIHELESAPKGETFTKLYHKIVPFMVECELSASELRLLLQRLYRRVSIQ